MEIIANPPWYIPTILAAVAIIFLFQGNNRQNRGLKRGGLAFAVAAVLVYLVSYLLESPHEKVIRQTQQIAAAVDGRDWKTFGDMLDPKVRFWQYDGSENLKAGAEKSAERVDVKNIVLSDIHVTDEPGAYRVDFRATTDIASMPHRLPTNWKFFWYASDFKLYKIEYVPDDKYGSDAVFSRLIKP